MVSSCHVRNKIMYVLSWRTVSALTRVLIWCLTLSWALKQFVIRIHTLFSMYLLVLWQHHAPNGNNYQAQFQPFIHKNRSFITIYIKYEQISVHIGDTINKGHKSGPSGFRLVVRQPNPSKLRACAYGAVILGHLPFGCHLMNGMPVFLSLHFY